MRQVLAAAKHDTYDRLSQISCPVLIIHGSEDVMIPVGNAHLLKERVPHAELVVLEGSDRLRDGAKVEIPDRAARAAPGEGKAPAKGEGKRRRKEGA